MNQSILSPNMIKAMTEMEEIAKMEVVVRLRDKNNGDLMVKYNDEKNFYVITFMAEGFGGTYEEKHSEHATLSMAMKEVSDIIRLNVEHHFYDYDL